ncbi:MAG: type II toxin-antitoxin system HigB family toxin [Nitrospinota bacterium]
MKIVGRQQLLDFTKNHADARSWIATWIAVVEAAEWKTSQDIKNLYRSASFLADNAVVFNVKGNRYRLEVQVAYGQGTVSVKFAGTHAEYTRRLGR